jgi:hypothetical protein
MRLIITTLFFLVSFSFFGQKVVALHGALGVQMFSGADPFALAYNTALDGDTLYLPGGTMSVPSSFDKSVLIYGAGYHPDSTSVTLKTALIGTINLKGGASNSFFEGVDFLGDVLAPTDETIDFVNFKRCLFSNTINFPGVGRNISNFSFVECVFKNSLEFRNMTNSAFHNSIFQSYIRYTYGNFFSNSIYLYDGTNTSNSIFRNSDYNTFQNNIFVSVGPHIMSTYVSYTCVGNVFYHNLMVTNAPIYANSAIVHNDYIGIDASTLFVDQTGSLFDFDHDYHLQTPLVYIGNDGGQVGIYGGLSPFKMGAIPLNPHFQLKNISNQTNNNGELEIQVKVESQNN